MNDDTRILVSQLNGQAAWGALEEHLNELRGTLITKMLTGYASHDDYLRACGEIKGLDTILSAPKIPAPKRPATSTR